MCVCVETDLCYCSLQNKTEAVEELVKVLEGVCMCVHVFVHADLIRSFDLLRNRFDRFRYGTKHAIMVT